MAERRATNVQWQDGLLTRAERERLLGAHGATVWLTGLPSSGKTTIAIALEYALVQQRIVATRLDGDNIRHGLNKNLGFSREDRAENIRRIGEVAKLFTEAGCVAITAFISPYIEDRAIARRIHKEAGLPFFEVFVDTPLVVCEKRDVRGLYKKARAGELRGFTGVDDPYEIPPQPELLLKTEGRSVADCVRDCLALLQRHTIITAEVAEAAAAALAQRESK